MLETLLEALTDSLKIFALVFIINFIFSFFENKLAKIIVRGKFSPLIASALGLLPQCGFSVVASDLYEKKAISAGTVLAVFIATSDEAIPIFLSSADKFYMVLPLLGAKFLLAVVCGYICDIIVKPEIKADAVIDEKDAHIGCCRHEIEGGNESKVTEHLIHPLVHSIKIFLIVLAINVIFGIVIYYVTQESLMSFLQSNKYAAPAFAALIGLIPNCAASVVISKLYILGGLSFGACLSGLTVNAGLGLLVLYKNFKNLKNNLKLTAALIASGLIAGYACCLIFGF